MSHGHVARAHELGYAVLHTDHRRGHLMTHTLRSAALLVAAFTLTATGCANMNTARPLDPGDHAFGATFGGPTVLLGDTPLPLPNLVLGGRSGLLTVAERNLEVDYGLNVTALAFGITQAHVGASYALLHQSGMAPAVTATNRLYLAINPLSLGERADDAFGFWGADQVELTASWASGAHLLWVSVAQYFDFGAPNLLLTPAVGYAIDLGEPGGFGLQFETRWYGLNAAPEVRTVRWWPMGEYGLGSLGFSIGVSYAL